MNYENYKNNKPWLSKDEFTKVYVYEKGKAIDYLPLTEYKTKYKNSKLTSEKVFDEVAYKQMQKEYNDEESRCYNQFKEDLFNEYGVKDNPKVEQAFGLAWSRGHSCGYIEVENEFIDLVDLIK